MQRVSILYDGSCHFWGAEGKVVSASDLEDAQRAVILVLDGQTARWA